MADVNRQVYADSVRMYRDTLQNALPEDRSQALRGLVTTVPSNAKIEEYKWFNDFIKLHLWEGERKLADTAVYTHLIRNRKYEAGFEWDREDMDYGTMSSNQRRVQSLADAYPKAIRGHIAMMLANGHNPDEPLLNAPEGREFTGYDDVPFFAQTHPNLAVGTQANTHKSDAEDAAFDGDDIDFAVETMNTLVDENEEPLDLDPDTLVVGPGSRALVRDLFQIDRTDGGGRNPYFGYFDNVIVDNYLRGIDDAYLIDSSVRVGPMILQEVNGPELQSLGPGSDHWVKNDSAYYGVRVVYGMGYSLWQTAYRIEASGNQ